MRVLTCSLACVLAAAAVCDAAQLLEFVPLDALQAALNAGKPISFATPGRPESEASIPVCTLPDGSPRWVPGIPKGDAHTISVTLSLLGLKQIKVQNKVKAGDFEVHPLLAGRVRQDVTLADDESCRPAACVYRSGKLLLMSLRGARRPPRVTDAFEDPTTHAGHAAHARMPACYLGRV